MSFTDSERSEIYYIASRNRDQHLKLNSNDDDRADLFDDDSQGNEDGC